MSQPVTEWYPEWSIETPHHNDNTHQEAMAQRTARADRTALVEETTATDSESLTDAEVDAELSRMDRREER